MTTKRVELPEVSVNPFGDLMVHYNTDQMRTIHPEEAHEIAHRCNVHDELVDALEKARQLAVFKGVFPIAHEFEDLLEKARGDT